MDHVGGIVGLNRFLVLFDRAREHAVAQRVLVQKIEHAAPMRETRMGIVLRMRAQQHRIAHDLVRFPARIGLVANVGDAVSRQVLAADVQDRLLHRLRHPTVDAMTQDVVELAERLCHRHQILLEQFDVAQLQTLDTSAAVLNLRAGKIDSDRACLRIAHRERNEIAARRASQFKHARRAHVGRGKAERVGDCRQMFRRAVVIGKRVIRTIVVVLLDLLNGVCHGGS